MSEDHRIIGTPRGEPRPAGSVGVRVRVQLSGYPSRRWSHNLCARLAGELVGHTAVGHLRLDVNEIVQGDQIVLDGVEAGEAQALGLALERAVAAANRADHDEAPPAPNVSQEEADSIARVIGPAMGLADDDAPGMRPETDHSPCPACGAAVALAVRAGEGGEQLAIPELDCPGCGVRLVRNISGPADLGWKLAHAPAS